MAWHVGPTGVLDPGIGARELPRNLGDPAAPFSITCGPGQPHPNAPGPPVGVGLDGRDEQQAHGKWYCQPKDNEGRREGPQEVGTPRSTCEAGELTPWGPRGGKGASSHGIVGRKHVGDTELQAHVHETPTNSGASSFAAAAGAWLIAA